MTAPPSKRPTVRLSKLNKTHVRASELLRYLKHSKAVARLDTCEFFAEMARRGMLDPATAVIRWKDVAAPTDSSRAIFNNVFSFCLDLGLIEHTYPGDRRRMHLYQLTRDGVETLNDWDDPKADGLWSQ